MKRGFTLSRLIRLLWVWTLGSTLLVYAVLMHAGTPVMRAVIQMGAGLVLLWVALGGLLMRAGRDRVRRFVRGLPGSWQVKFVLFSTLLALLEEAVTVTMTNLAPVFGVPVGKAYITASANYLDVVCFHSVIVFIPWFIAWAWMLTRWEFPPQAVFLLFGLTGLLAEMGYGGPQHITEFGMWIFVYGLMIYLPAYSVPEARGARPPRWWLYPSAVIIPFLFMVLLAPFGLVKARLHPTDIHFPPINPNG